jgi:hypothetical protein
MIDCEIRPEVFMKLVSRSVVLASVFAITSCQNSLQPDQSIAVGSYTLDSVSGDGPATGSLVLIPGGYADRRVRYRQGDGSLSPEYVTIGTFHVTDAQGLDIALRENGNSVYVFKPTATLAGGILSLGYPGPADGWIVEMYKRQ